MKRLFNQLLTRHHWTTWAEMSILMVLALLLISFLFLILKS
jgi:hypothetical protein